jgi:hypothetical protein
LVTQFTKGQPIGSPFGDNRFRFGCGILFFGLFFVGGCLLLVMVVWGMLLKEWRVNNRYLPNTCLVLDKRVASMTSDEGGMTFRPEIRIRHEVDGRKYEVWTYDAVGVYSSGQAGKQAIIDRFQIGARYPCWYDPDRPKRAVLVRGYTWTPYMFLILAATFMAVGGGGLYAFWKSVGRTKIEVTQMRAMWAMQAGGLGWRIDPDRPTVPAPDPAQSPGSILPYRLPIGNPPGRTLMGAVFLALFWNGITAPAVVAIIAGHLGWDGMQGTLTFPTLVVIPFVLVGCVLIYIAVRQSLVTFGVGPTTVEASDHPLVPGGRCEIFLSQPGRLTMNSLRVLWICEEEAKYRDGSNTRTETRRVFEDEIIAKDWFEVPAGQPYETRFELRVPSGAMHSFVTENNQVRWKLVIQGDVARWPGFEREYPIVVLPSSEAAT